MSGDPRDGCQLGNGRANGRRSSRKARKSSIRRYRAQNLGELAVADRRRATSRGKLAKEVFAKHVMQPAIAPRAIMEREGLKQISDTGALEKIIEQVIAANPKQVEQYKGGKTTVLAFFVGQVMKATRGQANPAAVNELLRDKLA